MALSFYKLGGERDMQGSEEARRGADVRRWTQCRWEAAADSLQLLSTGTLPRALMQAAIHGHSCRPCSANCIHLAHRPPRGVKS